MSAEPELSRWKKFRYRLEWLGVGFLANCIPKLSRMGCVRLAIVLGELGFRGDRRGRQIALANLEKAFGAQYSPAQRIEIARASYRHFVRAIIDLFWSPRLNLANFRDYMQLEGFENIAARVAERGAISMCVHQGNWEWASLAWGFAGTRATIVAEVFKNSLLSDLFNSRREVSGHSIIPQASSGIRLFKAAKRREIAGLLVDLNLRPQLPSAVIETFGLRMCVTILPGLLARRTDAQLFPVTSESLPDGTCRITVHPPLAVNREASEAAIAQACWDFFEPIIRAKPELWLWAYKHWRYRPTGADPVTYPFYANVSGAFDKRLASQAAAR